MVTGAQACPGLSGLASCPEAALVILDTRAGGRDGEQGVVLSELPAVGAMEGSEGASICCPMGQGGLPPGRAGEPFSNSG